MLKGKWRKFSSTSWLEIQEQTDQGAELMRLLQNQLWEAGVNTHRKCSEVNLWVNKTAAALRICSSVWVWKKLQALIWNKIDCKLKVLTQLGFASLELSDGWHANQRKPCKIDLLSYGTGAQQQQTSEV